MLPHDVFKCLEAIHVRHLHIEGDHIRIEPLDHFDCLDPVMCLSDNLDCRVGTEHPLHGLPDEGRVINDQYRYFS